MTNNKVELSVSLDHEDGVVRAQSWLKGTVHMIVHETVVLGNDLSFQVMGKEKASIVPAPTVTGVVAAQLGFHHPGNGNGNGKSKGNKQCRNVAEHVIFDESRVIQAFGDKVVEPGTHDHLFSIYMPGFLPPTMQFQETNGDHHHGNSSGRGNGSFCAVEYVLTVRYGDEDLVQPIDRVLTLVGKPLSGKQYQCMLHPTALPVKPRIALPGSLIGTHGNLLLAAKIENQHVAKGRKFDVFLACRNQSKDVLESIDVHVVQQIDWSDGTVSLEGNSSSGNHRHERHEMVELDRYLDVELASLHRHVEPVVDENDETLQNELQTDLSSADRSKIQLKIPSKALDSYDGKLIKVRHYLKITLVTAGRSQNQSVSIPLEVFDPPIEPSILVSSSTSPHHHSPSREKVAEIVTTYWPKDNDKQDLVAAVHHPRYSKLPEEFCSSINENEPVVNE